MNNVKETKERKLKGEVKEALAQGYLSGRLEVRSEIVNSLRRDYILKDNLENKIIINPIKIAKLQGRIEAKEELLGISRGVYMPEIIKQQDKINKRG